MILVHEDELCKLCPSYKDDYCGYVSRKLQRKCLTLQLMASGYEQAIEDVKKIIYRRASSYGKEIKAGTNAVIICAEYGLLLSNIDELTEEIKEETK